PAGFGLQRHEKYRMLRCSSVSLFSLHPQNEAHVQVEIAEKDLEHKRESEICGGWVEK
ncbi:hypothetical protein BHE74_00046154, partial [Ensete ventricosum]